MEESELKESLTKLSKEEIILYALEQNKHIENEDIMEKGEMSLTRIKIADFEIVSPASLVECINGLDHLIKKHKSFAIKRKQILTAEGLSYQG